MLDGANKIQLHFMQCFIGKNGNYFGNINSYKKNHTLAIIKGLTILYNVLVQGWRPPIFGIHDILYNHVYKKKPPSTPWCISYKTMGIWFGCTYHFIT
jgi:hypothetical protein